MAHPVAPWKQLYNLARSETDPEQRRQLCEQARRAIHERTLELASATASDLDCDRAEEEEVMDRALRDLWVLENSKAC